MFCARDKVGFGWLQNVCTLGSPVTDIKFPSEQYAKLVVHVLSCLAAFEREKYKEEEMVEGSKMEVDGEEVRLL